MLYEPHHGEIEPQPENNELSIFEPDDMTHQVWGINRSTCPGQPFSFRYRGHSYVLQIDGRYRRWAGLGPAIELGEESTEGEVSEKSVPGVKKL
jgi:hypothetical protein